MKDNKLSVTEIQNIADASRKDVERVKNGIEINNKDKAIVIEQLLNIDKALLEMFLDERFCEMCEVAISKARNIKVRKFAVHCQHTSQTMRYKLFLTDKKED